MSLRLGSIVAGLTGVMLISYGLGCTHMPIKRASLASAAMGRVDPANEVGSIPAGEVLERVDAGPSCRFLHVENGCWSWSARNSLLEAGFVTVAVIDYLQTRTIVLEYPRFVEVGPFLPTHPTMGQLNTVAIVGTIAHLAVASAVPRPWRDLFQTVTFSVEAVNVGRNFAVGLNLSF